MDRKEKDTPDNAVKKRPVHRRRPEEEKTEDSGAKRRPRRRVEDAKSSTDGIRRPEDVKSSPDGIRRRTDGIKRRSADGKSSPDGIKRRPADGKSSPDGIKRRPADRKSSPDGIKRRPADGKSSPDGIKRRPADGKSSPDGIKRRPADGKSSPDGIKRRPANGKKRSPKGSKSKKQQRATFNLVSTGVLIVAVCVFVFSLFQLVRMLVPYYSGGKEYDKIKDIAITADEEGNGFKVDFDALLKENSDTVAWIRFDEPEIINYPVVKSADNTEYLTKTFSANDNKLGAIFVDMRNRSDFSDRNTFIYGHHLNVGGERFSELLQYESESFCKKHPDFYIYTPDGKVRTYTVFSAGVVKDTADNYKIEYASDQDFEEYLKLCQDSSNYKVDVELNAQSKIVSLSTCTNVRDDERFLVQGVLTATN